MIGLVVFLGLVYGVGCLLTLHEDGGKYAVKWDWPIGLIKEIKTQWDNRGSGPGVE